MAILLGQAAVKRNSLYAYLCFKIDLVKVVKASENLLCDSALSYRSNMLIVDFFLFLDRVLKFVTNSVFVKWTKIEKTFQLELSKPTQFRVVVILQSLLVCTSLSDWAICTPVENWKPSGKICGPLQWHGFTTPVSLRWGKTTGFQWNQALCCLLSSKKG